MKENQDNDPANRSAELKAMNSVWTQRHAYADLISGSNIKNCLFDNTLYWFFNIRYYLFDTFIYFHPDERMKLHFQIVLPESIDIR